MRRVVTIDRESLLTRFLRYVKVDTQSAEGEVSYPSTSGQLDLCRMLVEELVGLGVSDVVMDSYGYVVAKLPGRGCDGSSPKVGFIAHVDTSPDANGADVKPRVVERYDGTDILLHPQRGICLSARDFPELLSYLGDDIVVTDGTTLLGADDKAGVAAIMELVRYLSENPSIPHPPLRLAFTLDEEVGNGVKYFDLKHFDADFAFTVDGGELGELQYENFNAAAALLTFHGTPMHPGEAKGKMVNAQELAMEYASQLPLGERPENTSGREGFYHLVEMSGTVASARLDYIIRDHDAAGFAERKSRLREIADRINARFDNPRVELELRGQYVNMRSYLAGNMWIVERAREAILASGIVPVERPIRGGTDGARLSELGLPCPNLFAGGLNFHSPFEYLPVKSLLKSCEVLVRLCVAFAGESAVY